MYRQEQEPMQDAPKKEAVIQRKLEQQYCAIDELGSILNSLRKRLEPVCMFYPKETEAKPHSEATKAVSPVAEHIENNTKKINTLRLDICRLIEALEV